MAMTGLGMLSMRPDNIVSPLGTNTLVRQETSVTLPGVRPAERRPERFG